MKLKTKKGFTLIELLVVIVIIGILATLATVALSTARVKARDAKRISDIKQLQTALELYYNEESTYPPTTALIAGQALIGAVSGKTFMGKVPAGPSSGEAYIYNQINGGTSYTLGYTLEKPVNEFAAGAAIALPGSINNQCTPNCSGKNCGSDGCGGICLPNSCTLPQTCGGGGSLGVCGCSAIPQATACAGKCNGVSVSNGCGGNYNCNSITYCSGSNVCCKTGNICGNYVYNVVGYFYFGSNSPYYIYCNTGSQGTCPGSSGTMTSHDAACNTCYPGSISLYPYGSEVTERPACATNGGSGDFPCGSLTCQ